MLSNLEMVKEDLLLQVNYMVSVTKISNVMMLIT
jgi:hypothetical protein